VLTADHGDLVREAVRVMAEELMETEIQREIGAAHGEVSPERLSHRSGYRPRAWKRRVVRARAAWCRKRSGALTSPISSSPWFASAGSRSYIVGTGFRHAGRPAG
jgi:transposase-like protein